MTDSPVEQNVAADPPPAIRLRGISKSFGAVQANRDIDLSVRRGTIHGIVGENGAGKSTLMSILYGFYQADSGSIEVGGKRVSIPHSQAAIDLGIGMVHQHFMLVHNFTVLENVMLGAEGAALLRARHRPRPCRAQAARKGLCAGGRSRRGDRGPAGRAAAACRNPQGALSRRRYPDPRRADRRPHPGRGRPPVPHPPPPARRRQNGDPDHPQAARDHGRHRHRIGDAAGPDRRHRDDRRDLRRGDRREDGRPPRAAARRQGGLAAGRHQARRSAT